MSAAGMQRLGESQFNGALAAPIPIVDVPLSLIAAIGVGQPSSLRGPMASSAVADDGGVGGSAACVVAEGTEEVGTAGVAVRGSVAPGAWCGIGRVLGASAGSSSPSGDGVGEGGVASRCASVGLAWRGGAAAAGIATIGIEVPSPKAVPAADGRFCAPDPRGPTPISQIATTRARGGVITNNSKRRNFLTSISTLSEAHGARTTQRRSAASVGGGRERYLTSRTSTPSALLAPSVSTEPITILQHARPVSDVPVRALRDVASLAAALLFLRARAGVANVAGPVGHPPPQALHPPLRVGIASP